MRAYAFVVTVAFLAVLLAWAWPQKVAPPLPDPMRVAMAESLATARAEARRNLEGWQEALRVAPPDTVVRWATRYIRRHDTTWRDTGSADTIEVVRWLASSDSAQRVRGDSLEGVTSIQAYDLSVCLERLEDD